MGYTIISVSDYNEFIDKVNKHLSEGWQCTGGVFVERQKTKYNSRIVYYQAMTREDVEIHTSSEDIQLQPMSDNDHYA